MTNDWPLECIHICFNHYVLYFCLDYDKVMLKMQKHALDHDGGLK